MKVLILAAGPKPSSVRAADTAADLYPLLLAEEHGQLLVERLIASCAGLGAQLVFALRDDDCRRHHLDRVISLLSRDAALVRVRGDTAGAACTAMLAIEHIGADEELLIRNGNELVDVDSATIVAHFRDKGLDGGAVVFPSVHPRYSYVRLDKDDLVVEAAEKNPISRNATAGFYWYRRGKDFVDAACAMIGKGDAVDGAFYVCPAFNQLILRGGKVGIYRIAPEQYRPVKSQRQRELLEGGQR